MVFVGTVLVIVFVLAILLAFAFGFLNVTKREKFNPDYYIMFLLGLCWFVLGIIFSSYFVTILGIVLLVTGIFKRKEWSQEVRSLKINNWKEIILWAFILVCTSILVGVVFYFLN
mgnify:CR=1 FL=1